MIFNDDGQQSGGDLGESVKTRLTIDNLSEEPGKMLNVLTKRSSLSLAGNSLKVTLKRQELLDSIVMLDGNLVERSIKVNQ